ncbi:Anti-sigma-B factor antagonist [Poriferisphaera corsica]|uniref:Anti-sigma-B factor antagonist n=1 Tax=Poriferisphaera corsica TaxID=2528020 RepID=A0A517YYD4_9BACT|nr:STAS domain-containing protein [Poriferisphaera corsica]QDU35229.1 Anti-sigma-B factor antagonist [Poriferisphaera corsica]
MLPSGMEIDINTGVATCKIDLPEVTHLEMQEMVDECMSLMRNDNIRNFVFDLEAVEFLASSCIGALVSFLQDIEHVKGKIAIANCKDNVSFLFKVTRLDSVFAIYDDVDDAIASF